ncbi:hypothetical protein AB1Y20_003903 [Prymnesium parvum]|uniref:PPIase cyclophilin-type domain-containing protein n=1 Tax=Prymnesium parvum TaxID=97485 RepID=A0AB34J874_PRYPA
MALPAPRGRGVARRRGVREWVLALCVTAMLAACYHRLTGTFGVAETPSDPTEHANLQIIKPPLTLKSPPSLAPPPAPPPLPTQREVEVAHLATPTPTTPSGAVIAIRLEQPSSGQHWSLRLKLLPEFSQSSVDFMRYAAATGCNGELYRSEKNFLVQGRISCPKAGKGEQQPKVAKGDCPSGTEQAKPRKCPPHDPNCGCHGPIMTKGMVGWAGGSAGPDFFIYTAHMEACKVGGCPATHWNHDHTVFAEVADKETWDALEALYTLPTTNRGMVFFQDKITITSVEDAAV